MTLSRDQRTVRAMSMFLAFLHCLFLGLWILNHLSLSTRMTPNNGGPRDDGQFDYVNNSIPDNAPESFPCYLDCRLDVKCKVFRFHSEGELASMKKLKSAFEIGQIVVFVMVLIVVFRAIQLSIRAVFHADPDPDEQDGC